MKKKYENFSLNANATLNTNSKKLNQTVGPKKIFVFSQTLLMLPQLFWPLIYLKEDIPEKSVLNHY